MTQAPRYFALIPAAGVGARMGSTSPKQYLKIGGKPMLRHTLDAFLSSELIAHTFVVVSPDDPYIDAVAPHHGVTVLRCGGASRMESVRNGLAVLASTLSHADWVLVHDAARPGLTAELIEKLITGTGDHPAGGLLALPVVDTVKRCIDGSILTLEGAAGPPLGLFADLTYEQATVALVPYDLLVLYTDGITEAMDTQGNQFGLERFDAVLANCGLSAQALMETMLDAVSKHCGTRPADDDRTLLVGRVS